MSQLTSPLPVLISEDRIRQRVQELAREISLAYAGLELHLVCTMGGAGMFFVDLVRQLDVPTRQHYLAFTSFGKGTSGEARITLDVAEPLEGRHVLLVEGVIVSGRTPRYILEMMKLRQPASVALCTLILKRTSLAVDLAVPHVGFELGSEIATGYGIGLGPERALPHIVDASSAH